MSDKKKSDYTQISFGDDPSKVGQCVAITFVIQRHGSKLKGRIVRRQEYENGVVGREAVQAEEKVLSDQYKAPVMSMFFPISEKLADHEIEQRMRQHVRAFEESL